MPKKFEPKPDFLTTEEVADALRYNIWTIKKMLAKGEFTGAFKAGEGKTSPWRIPRAALESYIRKQQKQRDRK